MERQNPNSVRHLQQQQADKKTIGYRLLRQRRQQQQEPKRAVATTMATD